MLQCCGNPNKWPMVVITPEEDDELKDLFELQDKEPEESKFAPLIKTPIPELREVLADFLQFNEEYHIGEAPEARKYSAGDLLYTEGTSSMNDSSMFSDARLDDSRQVDSSIVGEIDLVTEQKSDITVKTDKTDVIQATHESPQIEDFNAVQEPALIENDSVFTNPDVKPQEFEEFEVRTVQSIPESETKQVQDEPMIELPSEEPIPLKLPAMPAKLEIEEPTDVLAPPPQGMTQDSDKAPIVLQTETIEEPLSTMEQELEQEQIVLPVVTEMAEVQEDQIQMELQQNQEVTEPEVVQVAESELEEQDAELEDPVPEIMEEPAPETHVEVVEACKMVCDEPKNKPEQSTAAVVIGEQIVPENVVVEPKSEKKEKKRAKTSKKESTKLEVPTTVCEVPEAEMADKPLEIKAPGKSKTEEKQVLLLSSAPKEVPESITVPARLSIETYFQASQIRQAVLGHEMRKAEHEMRKSQSPVRHIAEKLTEIPVSMSPMADSCSILEEGIAEPEVEAPSAVTTEIKIPEKETPLTAKERMEKLLNSLERSVNERAESEDEHEQLAESQFSNMIKSGMMTEIPPKEEEVIENVELLATSTEIIGYQFRQEIFRIPIFTNRILIDDDKRTITLLGCDKRYKLPSTTLADHQFKKERLQALFKYETLENIPKTPIFRIDTTMLKMQIVENGITTSLDFDEIEYDSFKGSRGFVKMRANGYTFVYQGSEEEVCKLIRCLQDAGAHQTMLESSMSQSQPK